MAEAKWYVAHTYSGYENKVLDDIKQTIKNRNLEDQILDVSVPLESVIEIRDGKEKKVTRKVLPGYVLIKMIMNDDTWYVVRNTRGVTGFVGPGSKPVPLTEEEMRNLGFSIPRYDIDIKVGDTVSVVHGAWQNTVSVVTNINQSRQTVTINVDMFGRETPIDISFSDIEKI